MTSTDNVAVVTGVSDDGRADVLSAWVALAEGAGAVLVSAGGVKALPDGAASSVSCRTEARGRLVLPEPPAALEVAGTCHEFPFRTDTASQNVDRLTTACDVSRTFRSAFSTSNGLLLRSLASLTSFQTFLQLGSWIYSQDVNPSTLNRTIHFGGVPAQVVECKRVSMPRHMRSYGQHPRVVLADSPKHI